VGGAGENMSGNCTNNSRRRKNRTLDERFEKPIEIL